jgi:hypothetical protein
MSLDAAGGMPAASVASSPSMATYAPSRTTISNARSGLSYGSHMLCTAPTAQSFVTYKRMVETAGRTMVLI